MLNYMSDAGVKKLFGHALGVLRLKAFASNVITFLFLVLLCLICVR